MRNSYQSHTVIIPHVFLRGITGLRRDTTHAANDYIRDMAHDIYEMKGHGKFGFSIDLGFYAHSSIEHSNMSFESCSILKCYAPFIRNAPVLKHIARNLGLSRIKVISDGSKASGHVTPSIFCAVGPSDTRMVAATWSRVASQLANTGEKDLYLVDCLIYEVDPRRTLLHAVADPLEHKDHNKWKSSVRAVLSQVGQVIDATTCQPFRNTHVNYLVP